MFGMPHLLVPVTMTLLLSGGVGTTVCDVIGGVGTELICCDELKRVILLCRPPTEPPINDQICSIGILHQRLQIISDVYKTI